MSFALPEPARVGTQEKISSELPLDSSPSENSSKKASVEPFSLLKASSTRTEKINETLLNRPKISLLDTLPTAESQMTIYHCRPSLPQVYGLNLYPIKSDPPVSTTRSTTLPGSLPSPIYTPLNSQPSKPLPPERPEKVEGSSPPSPPSCWRHFRRRK